MAFPFLALSVPQVLDCVVYHTVKACESQVGRCKYDPLAHGCFDADMKIPCAAYGMRENCNAVDDGRCVFLESVHVCVDKNKAIPCKVFHRHVSFRWNRRNCKFGFQESPQMQLIFFFKKKNPYSICLGPLRRARALRVAPCH